MKKGEVMTLRKCQSCEGHGYAPFSGNRGAEIQRNDECECLRVRTGLEHPTDKHAQDLYRLDLKNGSAWALRCQAHLRTLGVE